MELRALPQRHQSWVRAWDTEGIVNFAREHTLTNVYFGVASRLVKGDGSLRNCGHIQALWCDVDYKSIAPSDAALVLSTFPFPPSITVASGGGLHHYWLLKEPLTVADEAVDIREGLTRIAYALKGDRTAAEPARILRLPETTNYKYQPPRFIPMTRFDSSRAYNLADFIDVLPPVPIELSQPQRDPNEPVRPGERNDYLYRYGRGLWRQGTPPEILKTMMVMINRIKCVPPLPDRELAQLTQHILTQPFNASYSEYSKSAPPKPPRPIGSGG